MIIVYEVRGLECFDDDPYYKVPTTYGYYTTRVAAENALEHAKNCGYGFKYDVYELPIFDSITEEWACYERSNAAQERLDRKAQKTENRRKAKGKL